MSDHPPIPPNCEYFHTVKMDSGSDEVVFKCVLGQVYMCDIHLFSGRLMRPIIAAVARAAWQDEFRRINQMDATPLNWSKMRSEAAENVEAWRVWGECK